MVSTSGHQRLHAASIYTADRPCAFGAVRSYCSLHIVTVLTENHIFSCVCACKAAYKQRILQLLVNANAHMYPPYTQTAACVRWMHSEVAARYILYRFGDIFMKGVGGARHKSRQTCQCRGGIVATVLV